MCGFPNRHDCLESRGCGCELTLRGVFQSKVKTETLTSPRAAMKRSRLSVSNSLLCGFASGASPEESRTYSERESAHSGFDRPSISPTERASKARQRSSETEGRPSVLRALLLLTFSTMRVMRKTLIAVAGCHQNKARADAQRQTWVKDVDAAADVKFFLGRPGQLATREPRRDEVWLDCPDG